LREEGYLKKILVFKRDLAGEVKEEGRH
jgi:hypothetical protein